MKKAVFLDRDGVINRSFIRNGRPYAPTSLAEFVIEPEAIHATRLLHTLQYLLVVVTNQPDVATGIISRAVIEEMHIKIQEKMPIAAFKVCYHLDSDNCLCRKPKPGMLLDAAAEFSIDLSASFMVGDRWRDIEAGTAAGCHTIHIQYNYTEQQPKRPNMVTSSILEAAKYIAKIHS